MAEIKQIAFRKRLLDFFVRPIDEKAIIVVGFLGQAYGQEQSRQLDIAFL